MHRPQFSLPLLLLLGLVVPPGLGFGHVPEDPPEDKPGIHTLLIGRGSEKQSRQFVKQLAESIIAAAHPTATNAGVESFSFKETKSKTVVLTITSTYFGRATQRKYPATITVVVNISDPDEPYIDSLTFVDQKNWVVPNQKKLAELKARLNEQLGH